MSLKSEINKIVISIVPASISNAYLSYKWEKSGKPVPPPHIIKQKAIAYYQKKYGYSTLVETGTYLGTMIEAQRKRFDKIISIELEQELYEKAKKRFEKYTHIKIVQGDSGKVLPEIMEAISEPAIFWLDGHYSEGMTARGEKDCPIYEEMDAILNNQKMNHILLIDDARHFVGANDYPTIQELTDYLKKKNSNYNVEVKDDIIRCFI